MNLNEKLNLPGRTVKEKLEDAPPSIVPFNTKFTCLKVPAQNMEAKHPCDAEASPSICQCRLDCGKMCSFDNASLPPSLARSNVLSQPKSSINSKNYKMQMVGVDLFPTSGANHLEPCTCSLRARRYDLAA